jgi:hypothetical protein
VRHERAERQREQELRSSRWSEAEIADFKKGWENGLAKLAV